eukprot:TRINITY_DN14870_c0_g1_i1.p1 TRINITY_DN14870_c0_g1~~TRINITY_DN14870_c0_g1_i1.p1  ORF type:complete len:704 (+),score=152.05 TRINITY_DN14870_c0_g1_i1:287-2398(+)
MEPRSREYGNNALHPSTSRRPHPTDSGAFVELRHPGASVASAMALARSRSRSVSDGSSHQPPLVTGYLAGRTPTSPKKSPSRSPSSRLSGRFPRPRSGSMAGFLRRSMSAESDESSFSQVPSLSYMEERQKFVENALLHTSDASWLVVQHLYEELTAGASLNDLRHSRRMSIAPPKNPMSKKKTISKRQWHQQLEDEREFQMLVEETKHRLGQLGFLTAKDYGSGDISNRPSRQPTKDIVLNETMMPESGTNTPPIHVDHQLSAPDSGAQSGGHTPVLPGHVRPYLHNAHGSKSPSSTHSRSGSISLKGSLGFRPRKGTADSGSVGSNTGASTPLSSNSGVITVNAIDVKDGNKMGGGLHITVENLGAVVHDPILLESSLINRNLHLVSNILLAADTDDYDQLSQQLVIIFESNDRATNLLKWAMRRELWQHAGSTAETLFREDSMVSKLVGNYFNLIGKSYLRHLLEPFIANVMCFQTSYEVDPDRSGENVDVRRNLRRLEHLTHDLLQRIVKSTPNCPPQIRTVFYFLRKEVSRLFPDHFLRALGSFLFLRFICPAIVSPTAFGITDKQPTSEARRALVLIAKTIQNVVNAVAFGDKEQYMLPMNQFIANNFHLVQNFLFRLSSKHPDDLTMNREATTTGNRANAKRTKKAKEEAVHDLQKFLVGYSDQLADQISTSRSDQVSTSRSDHVSTTQSVSESNH